MHYINGKESCEVQITPLVIYGLVGVDTHMHAHTHTHAYPNPNMSPPSPPPFHYHEGHMVFQQRSFKTSPWQLNTYEQQNLFGVEPFYFLFYFIIKIKY